jgi:hypothetical protein
MTGSNELRLNPSVLLEALQFYFESKVFTKGMCPKVLSVTEEKPERPIYGLPVAGIFVVKIERPSDLQSGGEVSLVERPK